MYQESKLMFLYCETSLHAGAGTGVGRIDLPIQREIHTGFPKIESSGIKGAIREVFEEKLKKTDNKTVDILFGHEQSESSGSGSLGFTDARILLFPVRSAKGIFSWVTCPRVLWQLKKDFSLLQNDSFGLDIEPIALQEDKIIVFSGNKELENDGKVMLEEFVFTVNPLTQGSKTASLNKWIADQLFEKSDAFQDLIMNHLAIVHDNVFAHFVKLYTEVVTRNKIDNETGIVQKGALFVEEFLPSHSVLYSIVLASPQFASPSTKTAAEVMNDFVKHFPSDSYFQAGGNATIGKGILKTRFYPE